MKYLFNLKGGDVFTYICSHTCGDKIPSLFQET